MAAVSSTSSAQRAEAENAPPLRKGRLSVSHKTISDRIKHRFLQERARVRQNARSSNIQLPDPTATAVAADWMMGESPSQVGIPVFNGITLPRQLPRPPFREPGRDALAAIDPALVDTSVEFTKDCLEMDGAKLFDVLKRTSIVSAHRPHGPNSIPTSVRVRVSDAHAALPTHYLAIFSSLPSGADLADPDADPDAARPSAGVRALFSPVHSLMLAMHFPCVRPMQRSDPAAQLPTGDTPCDGAVELSLPVFALPVSSPRTFHLLLSTLYTQRYDNLLRALLGIPLVPLAPRPDVGSPQLIPSSSSFSPFSSSLASPISPTSPLSPSSPASLSTPTSLPALDLRLTARITLMSTRLAATYHMDANALLRRARLAVAMAANARMLGVCDAGLWGALDVAWAVILGALSVCAGGAERDVPSAMETEAADANAEAEADD
ncbi:hypothetical protein M0805_004651 [Coniferiporia weirii]|nr:hypothetical protein M0805_004651 [Coniferiporia weirii]